MKRRAFALTLAVVVLTSVIAPALALSSAPAAAAASGPSDMVALGDAQVSEDLPADTDAPIRASDLEGNVWASEHADTLDVTVTTPDRAGEYVDTSGTNVLEGDDVALIVADSENHAGREIAVGAQLLEDALGHRPEAAFGVHSSGEDWSSEITYDNGAAVFGVPKFSENTVSFTGGISLSGANAVDGTSYSYNLSSINAVDNFDINLTGRRVTANESTSGRLAVGESLTAEPGGTTPPEDATVELEGVREEADRSITVADGDSISVGGNVAPENETVTLTGSTSISASSDSASGGSSISLSHSSNTVDIDNTQVSVGDLPSGPSDDTFSRQYTLSVSDGSSRTVTVSSSDGYVDSIGVKQSGSYSQPFEIYVDGTLLGSGSFSGSDWEYVYGDPIQVSGSTDIKIKNTGSDGFNVADGEYLELSYAGVDSVSFSSASDSTTVGSSQGSSNLDYGMGESISVSINGPYSSVSYSADYDEITGIEDPSVSIGSETVSYNGLLDGSVKRSINLSTGSYSVSESGSGDLSNLATTINWTEISQTEDPAVDVDGTTIYHSGLLGPGETVSESVSLSETSSTTIERTGGSQDAIVRASWTEVSETTDAGVRVNGNERTIDGTIPEGQTESLPADEAWLQEGTNEVEIVTADAGGGPAPEVGFEYQHEAGSTSLEETVEASTWKESYNVSHTFPSEQAGAEARLAYADNVIEVRDLEKRTNGGSWESIPESEYELKNSTLVVDLGDVAADTSIDIRATGGKVMTYDGTIDIAEPTAEGDSLATEIEVTDVASDGMLGIDVSGTAVDNRVHFSSDESFEGTAHAEVTASGDQILRAPDANTGSTMTIETMPVSVSPESGAMEVEVEHAGSEPRFRLREGNTVGASSVEVGYYDTLSGERYVLWSETEDREVDADRAESPVFFTTDGSTETYSIKQRDDPSAGGGGAAPTASGSGLTLSLILPAVAISVGGLWWAGRRFGGARGVRGNMVLLVGSSILAIVAAELVTPRSLTSDIVFALGDSMASGAGAVILSVLVLVGIWQIDQRTSADVPWWITGISGFGAVVLSAEAIRPGSILGALEGALSEVGAAVILLGIIVLGAILWRRASTPDTQVTIDSGGDSE